MQITTYPGKQEPNCSQKLHPTIRTLVHGRAIKQQSDRAKMRGDYEILTETSARAAEGEEKDTRWERRAKERI
ncbi:hypothetical protein OE88DRAFT_1652896, partial [Heliocybe sulcata]